MSQVISLKRYAFVLCVASMQMILSAYFCIISFGNLFNERIFQKIWEFIVSVPLLLVDEYWIKWFLLQLPY